MQLIQLLIAGVAQGCIYGLIALGFVLIYKATETVSFAQGDLMALGAFCGLALMTLLGWPFWAALDRKSTRLNSSHSSVSRMPSSA